MNDSLPATNKRRPGRRPSWPRIRARGRYWMVDAGIIDGKRVRRTFSSLADAEAEGDRLRAERNAKSQTAKFEAANRAVSLAKLSDAQRGDVLAALRALSGRGTLTGAVDFFLKHAAPESARSVAEIIAELLAAVRASGRRPRTVAELKWRLEVFGKRFGAVPIMSVTPRDIEAWIAERTAGAGPVTRDNERRGLFRLFAFAVKRNYAERNPVASLERTTIDASATPSIHTPDEVQKVLAAVATHAPRMIPYYAIGYFAGLRPENELRGLHWTDIDFKSGLVHVRPETAKKRRERYVDLAPNLAAWLAPHRKESGPITYTHYSFKKVRKSCGVKWSPDVMRHTFATMHFAANNDAPRTAAQLGHSGNPGVLFNHYRRLIRPDVAEAFWKLMPPTPGGVISIGRKDKQAAG